VTAKPLAKNKQLFKNILFRELTALKAGDYFA